MGEETKMTGTTISGSHLIGITLTSSASNPVFVTGTISVSSGDALYGKPGASNTWTINNSGTIISRGATGVFLGSYGGSIASGMLTNSSYVYGANYGVYIQGPGSVTNLAGATIAANANEGIQIGSDAKGTVVNAGVVLSQNTAIEEKVGGAVTNLSTGTINGTSAGVRLDAAGTVVNAGTIIGSKAIYFASGAGSSRLIVDPGAVFTGNIYNAAGNGSGVIELASAASVGRIAGFDGSTITNFQTLQFDTGAKWTVVGNNSSVVSFGQTFTGLNGLVISGFTANDTIDLTGFVAVSKTFASNALTLTDAGNAHATLHVQGTFTTGEFQISGDGSAGTDIILCFVAGTWIATPAGSSRVEDLAIGDLVHAHFAGATPIQWIGRRHADCMRHPDPREVWPVRVAVGAFGPGRPYRELLLSPNHAVYVGGDLIPVGCLINGTSIVQLRVDEVTYYHLELVQHDLLMTEGLLTESYLDTGDRSNFTNCAEPVRLFPDFATRSVDTAKLWETRGCARLVIQGSRLEAARSWVNGLAGAGSVVTGDRATSVPTRSPDPKLAVAVT
jgi:hypothetical protein